MDVAPGSRHTDNLRQTTGCHSKTVGDRCQIKLRKGRRREILVSALELISLHSRIFSSGSRPDLPLGTRVLKMLVLATQINAKKKVQFPAFSIFSVFGFFLSRFLSLHDIGRI